MPRFVLLTTAALTAMAAVFGFMAGQRWQPLDETQVIEAVAARYVQETGGQVTDCVAVPARHPELWLRMNCGEKIYHINQRGRIVPPPGPDA